VNTLFSKFFTRKTTVQSIANSTFKWVTDKIGCKSKHVQYFNWLVEKQDSYQQKSKHLNKLNYFKSVNKNKQ
jgi:hypothetical protein